MKECRVCRKTPKNERKTGKKNETKPSFSCLPSPKKEKGKKKLDKRERKRDVQPKEKKEKSHREPPRAAVNHRCRIRTVNLYMPFFV